MHRFPGYTVLEQLGETLYSIVYKARKEGEAGTVVIKTLKTVSPSAIESARLRHEFELIRRTPLEGIVSVLEIIDTPEGMALILEDFGGISLKEFLGRGPVPIDLFLTLSVPLVDTLGKLHQENIIHRDIKPQNILINPETHQVKITDFGIATEIREIYNPGVIEGTLNYISPEQSGRINSPVDYRTDLYSLGITFYEMLTGQVPFRSKDPLEIIHSHLAREPLPPERLNPLIPLPLSRMVMKLIAKAAEDRYQNSYGLLADLKVCDEQLRQSGTISPFELGQKDHSLRFTLPQMVIGRERELEVLYQAFDRVSRGAVESILVAGEPGIGKSTLINEIHKPIVKKRGYFISGKYDPFQKAVPYSALIQAFQGLVRQLTAEAEESIRSWREKLLWALGSNGKIITDIIPGMERIIGRQPDLPLLGAEETLNRFHLVFLKMIQVFADREHPLVLFLDDLQWADSSSLALLQVVLADREIYALLFIGAFRDNEVTPHHPLTSAVEALRNKNLAVTTVTLGPFELENIVRIICYLLRCNPETALPLARIIQTKTQGNPFFINQFLKTLYENRYILFDPIRGWGFDLIKIRELRVTDNVVEFLAERLGLLPPDTLRLLCICACLGNRFEAQTPADLAVCSLDQTLETLGILEREGLIIFRTGLYHFVHDRIREAAYSLLSPEHKAAIHYQAGHLALSRIIGEDFGGRLFYIVDQLNLGRGLLPGQAEKNLLAGLNLRAGIKAKESTAYRAAVNYLNKGLELLPQDSWQTDIPLTYALHSQGMECRYLDRDFEGAEKLFKIIISKASNRLDKARAYTTMVILYTNRGKPEEAVTLGFKALQGLGVHLPRRVSRSTIKKELLGLRTLLQETPQDSILGLPRMKDPELLAVHDLFLHIGTPVYYLNPNLFALLIIKGVQDCLNHGHSPHSALSFISLANILQSLLEDYELAFTLGETALRLNEQNDNRKIADRVVHTYAFFIQHWKKHLRFDIDSFAKVYELAVNHGDFIYAGHSINAAFQLKLRTDQHLNEILAEIKKYQAFINQVNDPLISVQFFSVHRHVKNLIGPAKASPILAGDEKEISDYIDWVRKGKNLFGLSLALYSKIILLMRSEKWETAYETAAELDKVIHVPMGTILVADHFFAYSRILIALLKRGEVKRRKKFLALIHRNQKRIKKWAGLCPENFQQRVDFIQAEIAGLQNRFQKAITSFHRAVEGAKRNGFLEEEAQFCERTAEYYQQEGFEEEAAAFLTRAHACYLRWGAMALAENLETRFPFLIQKVSGPLFPSDSTETASLTAVTSPSLDLSTVLEASQTISSEIVLDRLLEKIMKIALVNAGAQKGFLILNHDGQLTIEAGQDFEHEESRVQQALPLGDCANLSQSVVHYVFRSGESLILGNAALEGPFQNDPYIQKNRCRSILCAPILYQGRTSGILYMENNLTANAFPPERLELLGVISAQAAISLENAKLFELATTDGLTRLYVRRYVHLLLDQEVERAQRHHLTFSLIMMDIDDFKKINDQYGHPLGDKVLGEVARAIKRLSRSVDIAARYGGEEFVLILPETDALGALTAAEKIRGAVENLEIFQEKDLLRVTISLGVAVFPTLAKEKTSLIRCADQALYAAKRAGKNRVCLGEKTDRS
ncbi:MAG: diguanylate cyclase [Thermodesulfobacteriota bacterium]